MRLTLLVIVATLAIGPACGQATATSKSAWPTTTPQAVGLDPKALAAFDAEIASGKYGAIDSLLILRHGKVAFDRSYPQDYDALYAKPAHEVGALNAHDFGGPYNYFNPWWHPYYRRGDLHSMQSVTKSVTAAVIDVALSRHEFPSLDTPVLKYFDENKVANVDERKRKMTIRNLMTMTTGEQWQDDLPYNDPRNAASIMEASEDWVQFFIDQPMKEDPGAHFYYNDGAPEALAYIFQKATGQDIEEYAAKYLFAPIGIAHWYWKRIPMGLADTEGGLYLERHDLARLMVLFQHGGMWDGKQVIGKDWVAETITPAVTVNEKTGVKYGLLWWLYPYGKDDTRLSFGGSGFGGQIPVVIPDYDIVIVVNAWNILKTPGIAGLGARVAIDRVLGAVMDGKR